jgi:predicted secreted protein
MPPITGVGSKVRRWDAATSTWEELGEIKRVSGPTKTRATEDTTTLNTTGGYRTFTGGFRDGGQLTLECNYTRDAYDKLNNDFEDDTPANYEVLLPDEENTSIEFSGLVTELPLEIPEGVVTFTCNIKISGIITMESGSGPSPGV